MTEIKEIRISGFRGIKACLHLQFKKSDSYQSMIIYGRNGTGKSSITDAWEWLQTERIEHLRREGAGPGSYPHKFAQDGETYIEVDFIKDDLGSTKLEYDFARITKSITAGNVDAFRVLAPHPCFIRFEDLTRFVFLTKTEKFDALARLMGFTPQVELQKSFRRVLRNLNESIDDKKKELSSLENRLKGTIDMQEVTEEEYFHKMNLILERNDIAIAASMPEIPEKGRKLNDLVVNDPKAKALANSKLIQMVVSTPPKGDDYFRLIDSFVADIKDFLRTEHEFSKLLLLELYEHGEKVASQVDQDGNRIFSTQSESGKTVDICPLCGQTFDHDLLSHISSELKTLRRLKETRDSLEQIRKELLKSLPPKDSYLLSFQRLGDEFENYDKTLSLNKIALIGSEIDAIFQQLGNRLNTRPDHFTDALLQEIETILNQVKIKHGTFEDTRNIINKSLNETIDELQKSSSSREKLVSDNTNFSVAEDLWEEIKKARENLSNLELIEHGAEEIVEDYIQSSIANVENRFRTISDDVREFFEILEHDTEGLKGASIKLLADEDRAVELQVDFHGEPIYPAYKYLSESQLNSFGLAVFLASAKYFNSNFKFIILDDIINSFDGYKRPRIIELLKKKFSGHQILLLTHDNVWSDRLFEAFPSAVKKRFTRWELNHGPIDVDGFTPLEEIQQLVEDDKPVQAGSLMGPFLERQFQELCEKFEVMVKYSRLNEYTLDPLLDRFRVRAQEKLGRDHIFVRAVQNLYDETGFRNLCAHWKDPAIQLTREEMKAVVDKWTDIEKLARCQAPDCLNWSAYESSISGFVCPCGKTKLEKIKIT
jgi:hypothetical protein